MEYVLASGIIASFVYSWYSTRNAASKVTPQEWGEDVPQASEGVPIPVLFGRKRITNPNLIYFGDTARVEDDNYEGHPQRYYASAAFGLCHGSVDRLTAILVGEKVVWQGQASGADFATQSFTSFFVGGNGDGVAGTFYVRFGLAHDSADDGSAGSPHDYLTRLMKLPDLKGPQYYGLCQVQLWQPYLGTQPQLRPIGFEAERIMTRNCGKTAQWNASKARIVIGRDRTDTWKYRMQAVEDGAMYSAADYDDSAWSEGPGGFGNAPANGGGIGTATVGTTYRTPNVGTCVNGLTGCSGTWPNLVVESGTKLWVRYDLGRLPKQDLGVRLWHDDEALLWFNGTSVDTVRIESDKDPEHWLYNSSAVIPADLINEAGPNVVAYRVRDFRQGSIQRIYAGIQIGPDLEDPCADVSMNAIHVVREVITDGYWSRKLPEAKLDETSFLAAAETLYNERFGISFLWSKQCSARELITEVLRHVNGVLYEDPSTGKIGIKLVRKDYYLPALTLLDESCVRTVEGAVRRTISELINKVVVTYQRSPTGEDGSGSTTAQDGGLIATQGEEISETRDYPFVSNHWVASLIAARDLKVLSTPTYSMKIYANRKAAKLKPGQVFKFTWSPLELVEEVFRITDVDYGDGTSQEVVLSVTEDVFHTPSKAMAVPAGIKWPEQVLGPLPGSTAATKYYLRKTYDPNNRGQAVCCYTGYEGCGEWYMFAGFEELEDGQVMQATSPGPLTSNAFDGVDLDLDNHNGCSLLNKTVFAWAPELTNNRAKYCGWWIVEDIGGHYVFDHVDPDTQEEVWVWVNTYARFRRHPDFANSEAFTQGIVVQIQTGTQFGTDYLKLLSAAVALNETEQEWEHHEGPTYTWDEKREALNQDELATEPVSMDTFTEVRPSNSSYDGYPMLEPLGVKSIPAGPWIVEFEGVKIGADVPGVTTSLGLVVYRSSADGQSGGTLFETVGPAVHNTSYEPKTWRVQMPSYLVKEDDLVVFIPTCHTDSPDPVELSFIHGPNNGTAVTVPCIKTKEGIRAHHMNATRTGFASGIIIIPEAAETAEVTLSPGDEVVGIIMAGVRDGYIVYLTINGATTANPVKFKHQSNTVTAAASLWLSSADNAGSQYGDLEIYCNRTRLALQYRKADNSFQLLAGGSIG